MRKLHILLFAVLAVFAFAAMSASSALAFKELLWEGAAISGDLNIEISGEITLSNTGTGTPAVLCSGIFDVLTENGKTGFINEVLDLTKELLAELAFNLALTLVEGDHVTGCVGVKTCSSESDALAVALKLPWAFHIEEPETLVVEGIEYNLTCLVLGIPFELSCSGTGKAKILNDPVTGDAASAFENLAPNLSCDDGSEGNATFDTGSEDPLLIDTTGGLLTWS